MIKSFRAYVPFTRAGIQDAIAYRGSFLGFFVGEIFYCFVMYFIWKAVFLSSGKADFMGFSMENMTTYLFVTYITLFLTGTDSAYAVGEEIREGSIIMRMIKQIQLDFSLLFFELGNKAIVMSFVFLPVIVGVEIYRYIATQSLAFHLGYFIAYLCSIMLSYLLSFYLNLAFGYLAFFLMNLWGFNILKESILRFLSGAIIPIAFMPYWAQGILKVLPFSSLSYTPTMIYMGKYSGMNLVLGIGMQVFWVFVFYMICKGIWRIAEKHLCVQGG